jgi:23S rRNA (adenine2503-C2)-methyltransferase
MGKKNIIDLSIKELEEYVINMGEKRFRALQIYRWIISGIREPADMTNISKAFRAKLEMVFNFRCLDVHEKIISSQDNTIRYVFKLSDGNIIESVLMKYKFGLTVCISSQVGCKMGCAFCASARTGFSRNLSCGEMLDQILIIQEDIGQKIGNVVVMGIGEPFDNYENLIKFLKLVHCKDILNMGYRRITVSTCGLVPEIVRFAGEKIPVNLSVSLHASDDKLRSKIMPVNKKYSIDKLIKACKIYTGETNRRVTFEYIMISNYNDSKEHAFKLAKILKGVLCHVNLIPYNEIKGISFRRSKAEVIEKFKQLLESKGIGTTIRRELGEDIKAACGQLRKGAMSQRK